MRGIGIMGNRIIAEAHVAEALRRSAPATKNPGFGCFRSSAHTPLIPPRGVRSSDAPVAGARALQRSASAKPTGGVVLKVRSQQTGERLALPSGFDGSPQEPLTIAQRIARVPRRSLSAMNRRAFAKSRQRAKFRVRARAGEKNRGMAYSPPLNRYFLGFLRN